VASAPPAAPASGECSVGLPPPQSRVPQLRPSQRAPLVAPPAAAVRPRAPRRTADAHRYAESARVPVLLGPPPRPAAGPDRRPPRLRTTPPGSVRPHNRAPGVLAPWRARGAPAQSPLRDDTSPALAAGPVPGAGPCTLATR